MAKVRLFVGDGTVVRQTLGVRVGASAAVHRSLVV